MPETTEASARASESTPLLTVVRVADSPRRRYGNRRLRRACTTVLAGLVIILFTASLLILWHVPPCKSKNKEGKQSRFCIPRHPFFKDDGSIVDVQTTAGLSYEELQALLVSTPTEDNIKQWSQYYTSGPHLAGKNLSQAIWTRARWAEWGVTSDIISYDVFVNYPLGHRLALLEKNTTKNAANAWNVKYEASLTEDVLDEDPTSALTSRIPTFHGYSASGNVTGSYVYVNYGTYKDYEDLIAKNISLKGKIALAKYGGIFRGLKVKRAQELGMIGTIIYTDPGDDNNVTSQNGFETYPNGPARNPSSVQRGSVQFLSMFYFICLQTLYVY